MFLRAVIAFLVLPGTVAFLVPSLIAAGGARAFTYMAGVAPLAAGVVWHEEPFLARTQPRDWPRYAARVPRWVGRV